MRKKFLKDFYQQNTSKKLGFKLLKNKDVESMRRYSQQQYSPQKSKMVNEPKSAHDLSYVVQEFEIEDSSSPSRDQSNLLRIP